MTRLFEPLALPNGAILKNRIAKAAMEENLADARHGPSPMLFQMYRRWNEGGAGLLITGNVMVDARALTGPGGVVVEDRANLAALARWASEGTRDGTHFWMQINHPGRQVMANINRQTIAPSAVPLELGGFSKLFSLPRAMTEEDIAEVIGRFANTAAIAEEAGFTGVEIHAGHGFLVSQFLSPLANRRTDRWGGTLENRARLLMEIIAAVRARVSPSFGVAVKLNSADFQRGGFSEDDAMRVVRWLDTLPVDLIEISGGSFESPAMQGHTADERTLAREAYFLDFARDVTVTSSKPVMLTGGIRQRQVAERVLDSGVSVVGVATALALAPDLPQRWRAGRDDAPELPPVRWKNKPLRALARQSIVKRYLIRLAQNRPVKSPPSPLLSLARIQLRDARRRKTYHAWMQSRQEAGRT